MAELDLEIARATIRAVFAEGAARGLKPLTVAVVDRGGHLLALERSAGANAGAVDIARNKAHSAVMMALGGSKLAELSETKSWFLPAAREVCGGRFFPAPGAVLVRDDAGAIAGGVGVSGDTGANDAACAVAALATVGLVAEA
jgi:uncharacterized protein GlcG (DUF336 family)